MYVVDSFVLLGSHMSGPISNGVMKQLRCLTSTMSRCIVLMKDVNFISNASHGWHQQFVSIVVNIYFCTRFHKNLSRAATFRDRHLAERRASEDG